MARPKEFDADDALVRAMQLFWEQGFDATSLDELVAATGVNRASLYGTFGSKRELFLAAIDRYTEAAVTPLVTLLAGAGSPRSILEMLLRFFATCESGEGPVRGCLMANTALELGRRGDADLDARLESNARRIVDALARLVERGQADGEITSSVEPKALARAVFTTMQGMRVSGRLGATRDELDAVVDTTIRLLTP